MIRRSLTYKNVKWPHRTPVRSTACCQTRCPMSAGFGRGRSTAAGSRVVRRSRFPAIAYNLIAYHWLNTVMQSRRADYGIRIHTAAGQLRVACLARLSREERSLVAEVTYQLKLTRGQTCCAEQDMSPCDLNSAWKSSYLRRRMFECLLV